MENRNFDLHQSSLRLLSAMDTSKALAEQERVVDMLTEKMNLELRKF
jgi:hypothetical protein